MTGAQDAITPENLTNASQVERHRYSAFGELSAGGAISLTQRHGFTGHEHDYELGLINMRGRMFDPITSRFLSPDPLVHDATWSQAWNRYTYALNNPLKYVDPTGFDLLGIGEWFEDRFLPWFGEQLAKAGEGLLVGAVGAARASGLLGVLVGPVGAIIGGVSGFMTGFRGIYDWESAEGWGAFALDNTHGVIGTSMGDALNFANIVAGSEYDELNSKRQNRTVYYDGVRLRSTSAFAQGNVISMTSLRRPGSVGYQQLLAHETLHITQNRALGPLFQSTYVIFGVIGLYAATVAALQGDNFWATLETVAYHDNPFEVWAYAKHNPASYCPPRPSLGWLEEGSCADKTIGD